MKDIWACSHSAAALWETKTLLYLLTTAVKIKSAVCQPSAHLLFDESYANSSVDRKKKSNFISAFGLASFPVTLMTPERQWRNAFPLLRV